MKENIDTSKKIKYTLIETVTECIKTVEEILSKEKIIAIDCEGVYLSKEGRLTLLQVGISDERIFVFDILKGGSLMFLGLGDTQRGLKFILENKKILKLIHDCRNDWDSLLHQYSVRLFNFIDTQEAYFIFKLFYYQEMTLPISLLRFIESMTGTKLAFKDKYKTEMKNNPELWAQRPLNKEQLSYASEDVLYLTRAWMEIKDYFNPNLNEILFFLSILKVIDYQIYNQFKDFLFANIIYYTLLENVFHSKSVYSSSFDIDYVYLFLKIVNSTDSKQNENTNILALGFYFKKKQKINSMKFFKEEELFSKRYFVKSQRKYSEGSSTDAESGFKEKIRCQSNKKKNLKKYYKKLAL